MVGKWRSEHLTEQRALSFPSAAEGSSPVHRGSRGRGRQGPCWIKICLVFKGMQPTSAEVFIFKLQGQLFNQVLSVLTSWSEYHRGQGRDRLPVHIHILLSASQSTPGSQPLCCFMNEQTINTVLCFTSMWMHAKSAMVSKKQKFF